MSMSINHGRYAPDPGKVESEACGICGTNMDVERNRHGATGFAEAMAKQGHAHDYFTCPHVQEDWHRQAILLLSEANKTPSAILGIIYRHEAEEVISSRKVTKNLFET